MRKVKLIAVCVVFLLSLVFTGSVLALDEQKVNINTATVEELARLKKVGIKYSQRIIEFREKKGLFTKPEDIMKVKGIGEKIWKMNKDIIIVEETEQQKKS